MLPKGLSLQVTVAYLLCRIADTVEDSEALLVSQKRQMLDSYADIFRKPEEKLLEKFMTMVPNLPQKTADDELVYKLPVVYDVYTTFSPVMRKHIAQWVIEMSMGMGKFAQSALRKRFTFLNTMKELDEYTYYVAGTVGYLLTELFSYYSKTITPTVKNKLEGLAESFGKGLQLVNIIRDMKNDLTRGQSYIPEELLIKYNLDRESIFREENGERAEKLFNELIQNAVDHLDRALDYIIHIPKDEKRIRLFCMLPLFWAMRTLQQIQENTLGLLKNDKIKISRKIIRNEYYLALFTVFSDRLMRWHYQSIRKQFNQPLPALSY
jgi:farnesyl-diphosphate farnesyltransferase